MLHPQSLTARPWEPTRCLKLVWGLMGPHINLGLKTCIFYHRFLGSQGGSLTAKA